MLNIFLVRRKTVIFLFLLSVVLLNITKGANGIEFDFSGSGQDTILFDPNVMIDDSPIINSISLNKTEITDVFLIISDKTNWSIFPTSEVSNATVTLDAKNITAKQLLETVVKMAGFIYHQKGNIITVMTYDEYTQFYGLEKSIVNLDYGDADSIAVIINAYLSDLGEAVVHQETNSIVIFESEENLGTIVKIIEELDTPSEGKTIIKVINLDYMDAEELAETLRNVFSEEESDNSTRTVQMNNIENTSNQRITQPDSSENNLVSSPSSRVLVNAIGRTNQLIVKASRSDIEEINNLIDQLDVYVEPTTQIYPFIYVEAADVYNDLDQMLDISNRSGGFRTSRSQSSQAGGRPGGTTLIEQTNSILLTAPPSVHRIMNTIVEKIDVPSTYETGVIKTYKLNNADVNEVAATIRELLETSDEQEETTSQSRFDLESEDIGLQDGVITDYSETEQYIPRITPKVAVNGATNSIIIQATSRQHAELGKLITELDKRRKQVFIKPMIIEVATQDDTDFGVELDYINRDTVNFTSFGLSTIDPSTGVRDIIVSTGGTAAILNPNRFQAIIKALQGKDNVRIESTPQILVNDNAIGVIQSIAEQPTRQTNQGETTTTTSFGEYVTAGTQFYVTPHISDNNCLRVDYEITLNSFGEQADPELPPARNTSYYRSYATVPNGSTIVMGGIKSINDSESIDKVPLLGDLPLFGMLFRKTITRKQYITTYLFITTTIMEEEDFSDLKVVSQEAANKAMEENNVSQ